MLRRSFSEMSSLRENEQGKVNLSTSLDVLAKLASVECTYCTDLADYTDAVSKLKKVITSFFYTSIYFFYHSTFPHPLSHFSLHYSISLLSLH